MTRIERFREATNGVLNLNQFAERSAAGWRLTAWEWERETASDDLPAPRPHEQIPYGVRVSEDCLRLEVHPEEHRVLLLMMELIAQDFPLSHIASDLNEKGLRTREGQLWSQVSVFEMLPRLIDAGPRILRSAEWIAHRPRR